MKNPFRQPGHEPTPTMKVIWFVVLLALAATAVATLVLFAFIVFSAMLPTVPDAVYIHPTQFMGHTIYLSHFLDLAYSNIGLVFLSGFVLGLAALVTWSVLNEREKERRHNIRLDEMKKRGEFE